MTVENKRFISLEDILSIQLECAKEDCKTKVTVSPNRWENLPNRCPSCGSLWWEEKTHPEGDSAENALAGLHKNIKRLASLQSERGKKKQVPVHLLGCDIRLETKVES